eukprot:gene7319-8137_t
MAFKQNRHICMVISVILYSISAAPLTCQKAKDPQKVLDDLQSPIPKYIVVINRSPESAIQVNHAAERPVQNRACPYKFVETKKNPDQFPMSYPTAILDCTRKCDRRCKPVKYRVNVLKKSKKCDDSWGVKTWMIAEEEITIGYEMLV